MFLPTHLSRGQTGTTISIGGSTCIPISDGCTNTKVTCEVGDMPSGTYDVSISTANGYPKYDDGMNKLNFEYAVSFTGLQFIDLFSQADYLYFIRRTSVFTKGTQPLFSQITSVKPTSVFTKVTQHTFPRLHQFSRRQEAFTAARLSRSLVPVYPPPTRSPLRPASTL